LRETDQNDTTSDNLDLLLIGTSVLGRLPHNAGQLADQPCHLPPGMGRPRGVY
jgi:hypothetical protein